MKTLKKNKLIKRVAVAIIALFAVVLLCPLFGSLGFAYAYKTLPTGNDLIGNLYLGNGKFNLDNLNALAGIVGYDSVDDMVNKVSTESTSAKSGTNIKNSNNFGNRVVNFGSYTFNGETRELTWIPAFVSNSTHGPILTLWLATSANSNGTLSNQEVSTWSDGTCPPKLFTTIPKTYNGITVYNDTYASSYVRNYVLNSNNNYATGWGAGTAITPPKLSTMTKFSLFTGDGELADYLVTPSNVEWQMSETYSKNDPAWVASGSYGGTNENYPCDWVNDTLWLPSAYEVLYSGLNSNGRTNTAFTPNGGLWQTGSSSTSVKRASTLGTMIRSAFYGDHYGCYVINGEGNYGSYAASGVLSVRPALHLNLTMAADNAIPDHTHNFGEWQITPATCTQAGKRERVCSVEGCPYQDGVQTEVIPIDPTVHTFDKVWSSDENNHWHASTCGHEAVSGLAGHEWNEGEITTPVTCTVDGEKTFTCTVCGKTKTEIISAAGHNIVTDEAVEATCSHTGLTAGEHCTKCDYKIAQEVIPKTPHDWGEWVETPATEDNDGKRERECSVCHEKQSETIPALGHEHKYDNWVDEVPASCSQSGTKGYYECTCGKYFDENHNQITDLTIPATGNHAWGAWTEVTPATEDNDGVERRDCNACDEFETRAIPALGHTHTFADGWTSDGTHHWHAATCQHESEKSGYAEHSWNDGEVTRQPTCTEEGEKTFTCAVCNATKTESVPVTEHTAGAAATCTTPQTCTVCGAELAPATGHTEAVDEAVAPTCTETGLTEGKHCSVCETVIVAQEEVPATGHAYEWIITRRPTHEQTGSKILTCVVCGATTGEPVEIAKLVSDEGGNGDVIDLEPDKEYDLEILVKPTNAIYNVDGVNVGYEIALWIVVDGEREMEYDSTKAVTLMLRVPDEMKERQFELYKVDGIKLVPVEQYEVESNVVTLRTTLSAEIVFHAEAVPEKGGMPVRVWAVVAAVIAILVIVIVVILIKKKGGRNGGTPAVAPVAPVAPSSPAPINGGTRTVERQTLVVNKDDPELRKMLTEHGRKIDELLSRDDGGFGDRVELDDKGNIKR